MTPEQLLDPPPLNAIKWKKVIWYVVGAVQQGTEILQYNYGMQMRSIPGALEEPAADEWRRFQFIFDNTTSTVNADMAVFTLDVLNYTNGAIDTSWTQADHDNVASAVFTFLNATKTLFCNRYSLVNTKAYRMAFTPVPLEPYPTGYVDKPFADSGPPVYMNGNVIAMTGAGNSPDVVCSTVTEETPLRKHWGRFYTPPLAPADVSSSGRLTSANVDLLASSWNTCLTTLATQGFYSVVPNTQQNKKYIRSLSNVTGIHVDDIPDVIRRRRPKYVGYRKRYDEATP